MKSPRSISKFYRNMFALTLSLAISGCGTIAVTVDVPPLPLRTEAPGGKIPGRYAFILPPGTWNSHPASSGECSAYTFNLDPHPVLNAALKDLMMKSVQSVDFFQLSADNPKLDLKGYDAVIAASLTLGQQSISFRGRYTSATVTIRMLLTIARNGVDSFKQEISAYSSNPGGRILECSEASEYLANAMQHALLDEMDQIDGVLHRQFGSPTH